ncbi:MAG TPA: hypothetical protein VMF06_17140 [Candidatus Limnocylindria bacterium]|nr:hypothetical protein [Candidatus Limnocylindria bacterium]
MPWLFLGCLMAPISGASILLGRTATWLVCPLSLVAYFLRQAQSGFDSLGAPGYLEIAIALVYFPIVGGLLRRGVLENRFRTVSSRILMVHGATIAGALLALAFRERCWSASPG